MCKKACIAALAVLAGVAVVGLTGTKAGSYIRLKWNQLTTKIENQVSPETEIERLRLVLKEMESDDRRYEDQIAKLSIDVENAQTKVADRETDLVNRKQRVDGLNAALVSVSSGPKVVFNGKERSREDVDAQLKIDVRRYLDTQTALKNDKELLRIKRETLQQAEGRLRELRVARERAQAKLDQMNNALLEERRAQAAGAVADDGGKMSQFNKDLESLNHRVKVMQKTRELRGTPGQGPIDKAEATEKPDNEVDTFIKGMRNPPQGGQATQR